LCGRLSSASVLAGLDLMIPARQTVADNIALGHPDVARADIEAADELLARPGRLARLHRAWRTANG
jgi:hypothetical protein